MDLNFDLDNLFASNEMEEFSVFANMPGSILTYPCINSKTPCYSDSLYEFKEEDLELFDRVRQEFIRRVDQRINEHDQQGENINSLRVDFLLGYEHQDVIDKWISYAIAKGAERIEILFSCDAFGMPNLDLYRFPHALFSEFKNHLHLRNCHLLPHAEFSGFKQLKTLVLEELTFHPSSSHIVTPNLSSFEFGGGSILNFSSIDAPQLATFYLNSKSDLILEDQSSEILNSVFILDSLPQLQNLSMILNPSLISKFPTTMGPFKNLKVLELFIIEISEEVDEDYLWILDVVMACPRLQKLYIGNACPELCANNRQRREHPTFFHCELKNVEFHGCVGQNTEIELAIHFLKNAISLEDITFSPRSKIYLGNGKSFEGFDCLSYWSETGRNFIREELQDFVCGSTRLIFL
ncbi:uncharacterized protein [Cicer arietinum]|uniref:Uncharacterized protein LOC101504341 n=1 Tax=Cicer arietinum TaxID=3827 RepID=A0A1S2Z1L5_CICAR|nr:uncharacterized protein LOC101504341 [Cicer arietinum]